MMAQIIPLIQPDRTPRVSVVMVSYMTGPALLEATRAVLSDPDIYELILVDNGNTPMARHRLSEIIAEHDKVRVFQGHGNVGFSSGCNYGAKFARGEMLLFLNPDAVISEGAAMKLAKCGQYLERPWIVGGMLRDINGKEQKGARRRELTPINALATFTGLNALSFFKSVHLDHHPLPESASEMPVISGACLLTDRESFELLDGFDEKYFLHVEDLDICRRARIAGGEVYFEPSATVLHYGSTSRSPRLKVEWEKLKGFLVYFWKFSDGWGAKLLLILAAPFMTIAIMGRALWLTFRLAIIGR